MKLSTPKNITFWVAVILGVIGIIGAFAFPTIAIWFVVAGLLLLVLGNLLTGL